MGCSIACTGQTTHLPSGPASSRRLASSSALNASSAGDSATCATLQGGHVSVPKHNDGAWRTIDADAPHSVEEACRVPRPEVVAAVCRDAGTLAGRQRSNNRAPRARVLQEQAEAPQRRSLGAPVRKAEQEHALRAIRTSEKPERVDTPSHATKHAPRAAPSRKAASLCRGSPSLAEPGCQRTRRESLSGQRRRQCPCPRCHTAWPPARALITCAEIQPTAP